MGDQWIPAERSLSTAPRRRAVDLSLGDPLGARSRFGHSGFDQRVGQAAVTSSQNSVLEYLKRNHGVSWSVATLRRVIAGLSEGMESHRHDALVAQVLKRLEQAYASRGGRKPVLAVGRDGLMLPIRDGETATQLGP